MYKWNNLSCGSIFGVLETPVVIQKVYTVMSLACGHLHTVTLISVRSRGQDRVVFYLLLDSERLHQPQQQQQQQQIEWSVSHGEHRAGLVQDAGDVQPKWDIVDLSLATFLL